MAGAGLPRRARLRRAADFAALRRAEGRVRGTFFLLRYGPSEGPTARLGLAVSRKVSPRAVERNRIKRQIRESFRRHRPDLPNVDVLVIAHRNAADQANAVLRADIDRLWMRVRALKTGATPDTMTR